MSSSSSSDSERIRLDFLTRALAGCVKDIETEKRLHSEYRRRCAELRRQDQLGDEDFVDEFRKLLEERERLAQIKLGNGIVVEVLQCIARRITDSGEVLLFLDDGRGL